MKAVATLPPTPAAPNTATEYYWWLHAAAAAAAAHYCCCWFLDIASGSVKVEALPVFL